MLLLVQVMLTKSIFHYFSLSAIELLIFRFLQEDKNIYVHNFYLNTYFVC